MNAALIVALLLHSAPPNLNLESSIKATMVRHCVSCHDGDSSLDLRTPPSRNDTGSWLRIVDGVESYRMPQLDSDNSLSEHFPLDPSERYDFVQRMRDYI